jgi:hypothetical protein
MTLTVKINFSHNLPLTDVFSICQKAVNTPKGVQPVVNDDCISNPCGVGADCLMDCSLTDNGYQVSLDIPYSVAHEMHGIASRVLSALNVTEFKAYNECTDTWHDNLDFLG